MTYTITDLVSHVAREKLSKLWNAVGGWTWLASQGPIFMLIICASLAPDWLAHVVFWLIAFKSFLALFVAVHVLAFTLAVTGKISPKRFDQLRWLGGWSFNIMMTTLVIFVAYSWLTISELML